MSAQMTCFTGAKGMDRLRRLIPSLVVFVLGFMPLAFGQANAREELLRMHQSDLAGDGKTFLVNEANRVSFFLIGGMHGDQQTPGLIQTLWPSLEGYQHINVEMSPWAASRTGVATLRGTDIEEAQPHMLIRELLAINPESRRLQSMAEITKTGYRRSFAPQLFDLLQQAAELKDKQVGGVSTIALLTRTLEVEVERLDPKRALDASIRRETFMKELFETHYRASVSEKPKPKAIVVFGRNHLHRGIDHRGVSTLGNFVAEFAVGERTSSFNVALFGAGGKVNFGGMQDADERKTDPAFALLAAAARYSATVFDLRPLRDPLHSVPMGSLSAAETSLLYWVDSYDAIICYKEITPAK
jgi:hypothetical protein